ncbi:MAG: 4Fe-4S binding protein [bacterium]
MPNHVFYMKQLNKLRWICLGSVFLILIFIPFGTVYQNYHAAHAYDFLNTQEKFLYDSMDAITASFISDPIELDAVKGTTWSANILGWKITDPLAVVSQSAAMRSLNPAFIITALIPLVLTLFVGRFFCGWICPATFLYELNTNFALLLNRLGLPLNYWQLDKRIKYAVLLVGTLITFFSGLMILAAIYPPAILGREIYYAIAMDGLSASAIFFLLTMVFDILVSRRGFCRYLCPGGALYSLLGRYRVLRIQRSVSQCNDCNRCNSICEFGLQPMQDQFGQECNNCTACIAICPTDALSFKTRFQDQPYQGPGHMGRNYSPADSTANIIVSDANVK